MITTLFLMIFAGLFWVIVKVMGVITFWFPAEINTALVQFGTWLGGMQWLLPVDSMLKVFSTLIAFELAYFSFRVFLFFYSGIPVFGRTTTATNAGGALYHDVNYAPHTLDLRRGTGRKNEIDLRK